MGVLIDHDLHLHSFLSACSSDPSLTAARILAHAQANAYKTICLTDHVWDSRVPGASDWYRPQNIAHVQQALPLPQTDGIRFCFGCETEYCGGEKLGLAAEAFALFDFIVIPPNHFHMLDFVRPSHINTAAAVADLLQTRLEQLQLLELPWSKIGIAHLTDDVTFSEGNVLEVLELLDDERLFQIFHFFAQKGSGIELNAFCFSRDWQPVEERLLKPYRIAKAAGCKFYFASDAHALPDLPIQDRLEPLVAALQLTRQDIYEIP